MGQIYANGRSARILSKILGSDIFFYFYFMDEKNDKRNNITMGLLAILLGAGTLIGRNAQMSQIRLVDKLHLVAFGMILGVLITRIMLLKRQ